MDQRLLAGLLAPLLFIDPAPPRDALSFTPAEGSRVTKTFRHEVAYEVTSMETSFSLDGNEYPSQEFGSQSHGSEREIVIVDDYEVVEGARPRRVLRTFEEVSAVWTLESDGNTSEQEGGSELEGETVLFTWDEDEGEYEVAFAEDSDGDEGLLEDLEQEAELRVLLPPGEVAEGDEWEVDPARLMRRLRMPSGFLRIEYEESGEHFDPEVARAAREVFYDALEGELTASYAGAGDDDEAGLRRVTLSGELEAEFVRDDSPDGGEMQSTREEQWEIELAGEFLWDVEAGRLHSLELRCEVVQTVDQEQSGDDGDLQWEMRSELELSGTEEFEVRFE